MIRPPRESGPVGTSVPRLDGEAKVRGTARYVDDVAPAGVLHGVTVRSETAHGVLRALHRDPGFDWSGVTVVTADDVPGRNAIHLLADDQPALVPCGGRVRHADEPLALVAAADPERARAAARHLRPEIEPLEAVFDPEAAEGSPVRIHGDDNVLHRIEILNGDPVEEVLAGAAQVIEGCYRTPAQEQMYIEPQGMLAWFEAGRCRVLGSLQCPYYVHAALVPLLGAAAEDVVVEQAATGGGFGGKEEYPSMIAAHAALLARKAGAPVKLIYDRAEDVRATTKRHPAIVRHRLGLDADGGVLAIDVDLLLDGGAYLTLTPVVLSRAVLHAAGAYRCEHVRVRGRAVATNHPPHGAFRGFGAPQAIFATERQIAKAVRRLGRDPLEWRHAHRLRQGDRTATGQRLEGSVGSGAVLDAVAAALPTPAPASVQDGLIRGRGLAFWYHGAGFTGSGEERLAGRAAVAARGDGRFEVRASSTDIGQGAITTLAQIAAASLGVPVDRVEVADPRTGAVPDSGPTVASRTCMVVGAVVAEAATRLRERLRAAADPGAEADLAETARRLVAGGPPWVEEARYRPPPGVAWDEAHYRGAAYPVYGWAACAVDLAVDPDTWEVRLERCVHAVDVGRAINPVIVSGQIEGGTLQALGWALLENVVYRDGRVANASMTDCIIPTAVDVPDLDVRLVEEPYAHGPLGAKGVGEIPMDGPAAAVANALEAALGLPFDALPILPETIQAAVAATEER